MALFRRRQELEKMAVAEAQGATFWTRKFSQEARVKVLHAFRRASETQPNAPFIAHRMILEDEGRLGLGHSRTFEPDDLAGHILNAPDDEVASAIEACVAALFEADRANSNYPSYDAMKGFHQSVERILTDHRLSFELNVGKMVPFESRAMHAEVVGRSDSDVVFVVKAHERFDPAVLVSVSDSAMHPAGKVAWRQRTVDALPRQHPSGRRATVLAMTPMELEVEVIG